MPPLTAETVVPYLQARGHLPAGTSATITPLAWGVSNIVLRVEPQNSLPCVVKQSQPQLRTKIEWLSRCERIYREADVLRALEHVLPSRVVPKVLFEDRDNFVLGLEAIRADHRVWKQSLLEGHLDLSVAEKLGEYLAQIHSQTWGRHDLLPDADDWSLFDELRIDPYYRWLARLAPDTGAAFADLIEEMTAHRVCLVHADFSPKNVLVHPDGISLVDFETGHFGDPAFDVGFFLAHLLSKARHLPSHRARLVEMSLAFWRRYREGVEYEQADAMSARHTLGCLLARVAGRSQLEYLSDAERAAQRRDVVKLIAEAPATMPLLIERFAQCL